MTDHGPAQPDMPAEADAPAQPDADDEADWAAYHRLTLGREPRPLFARGMAALAERGVAPGRAVEIGFGDGTETLALLDAGWRVLAIDSATQAADVLRPRVPTAAADRLEIRLVPAHETDLPPFDLLCSGYALSFLAADAFRRLWTTVRARLRPGGYLVVIVAQRPAGAPS